MLLLLDASPFISQFTGTNRCVVFTVPDPENIDEVIALYKDRKIISEQACEMCGLTRGAFFRRVKNYQ